ncbi:MAG: cellulase family glycosylhydrolase, partial [Gorillibacterium sp.]|nr:cellulase family glycosylhydrolase [Gorillibacterium sp.]
GYKSIRIPITWEQRIGAAPNYTLDAAFLTRIQEVIDWAISANLYVMINVHHDSWSWVSTMGSDHDSVLNRYKAVWTQVANKFKSYSNKLVFESINEPSFSGVDTARQYVLLDELNTSFKTIVRASGGQNTTRPLVLPTLQTGSTQENMDELNLTLTKLNDPNLIATVHYYGFWPFSVNIAGYTKFETDTTNDVIQTFDRAYNSFVAKGIPVIVGEYGLLGFDRNTGVIEQGEKLKFFEYLTYYLKQKGITHMLWDNGQHFNRTTYKWADQDLFNVMKAGWTGRSATAATDLIYLKKATVIKDAVIPLSLNGNQLASISVNGTNLVKGQDYDLNGAVLTVKASQLTKLTASGQLGVNAVLTAKFNKGADWKFNVTTYSTPILSNIQGTTSAFAIPTVFNGDKLATMEAVYASGGNAGPQNWTSYKEFDYTFAPSYTTNEIKLQTVFFNEVNDGNVILKFHFWSGEVITYTLTKSGSSIIGKVS